MLEDANLMMSDKQDLSTATVLGSPYLSSKSIDLWAGQTSLPTDALGNSPLADIARGRLKLLTQVVTDVASAGAATLKAELIMADDEALTTNVVVLSASDAVAKASLKAGYKFRLGMPAAGITKRFLGVRFTVGTADLTAGKVSATLVLDISTSAPVGN